MNFIIETTVTISDKIKELIQSGNYELFILQLLNRSKKLFPNTFEHINKQSHGECDFIDVVTLEKYDAKLLLSPEQGRLIGSRNSNYEQWLRTMLDEAGEFGEYIRNRGKLSIENLKLYQLLNSILEKVRFDEHAIVFIPYPVTNDQANMIYGQFMGDILSATFSKLNENGAVAGRKVYAIYPCSDQSIAIRCLNTGVREYFSHNELKEYIEFDIQILKKS
jgi:hypothetical protein